MANVEEPQPPSTDTCPGEPEQPPTLEEVLTAENEKLKKELKRKDLDIESHIARYEAAVETYQNERIKLKKQCWDADDKTEEQKQEIQSLKVAVEEKCTEIEKNQAVIGDQAVAIQKYEQEIAKLKRDLEKERAYIVNCQKAGNQLIEFSKKFLNGNTSSFCHATSSVTTRPE